jgi:RNA polymerase sigma factor (sigma-70 family)
VNSFVSEFNTAAPWKEPDSVDDAMLVAVARSGDSSAFDELSRRHSRRVLHKIYRITNNWQDAEDVLQDSLMKAYIRLHTFECRASFSTWFTRIAINTALMLLRKEKRALKPATDSALDDGSHPETWELRDHRDNPEQRYARQQKVNLLRGAMQRLRPESRRLVELHQTNELSTKEIAQCLGISNAAVKSKLFRARIELRGFMQNETKCCHAYSRPRPAHEIGVNS